MPVTSNEMARICDNNLLADALLLVLDADSAFAVATSKNPHNKRNRPIVVDCFFGVAVVGDLCHIRADAWSITNTKKRRQTTNVFVCVIRIKIKNVGRVTDTVGPASNQIV